MKLHNLLSAALRTQSVLIRSYCRCCQTVLGWSSLDAVLCPNCAQNLPAINAPRCYFCALPVTIEQTKQCKACRNRFNKNEALHPSLAVCNFDTPIADWLHFFKSTGHFASSQVMGTMMAYRCREFWHRSSSAEQAFSALEQQVQPRTKTPSNGPLLIPVPSSRERYIQRGFNPAASLAQVIARAFKNTNFVLDALFKTRHTPRQGLLNRHDRLANLADAFTVNPLRRKHLVGREIVLIDDVMTTGATMDQLSSILIDGGVKSVLRLAFARTPTVRPHELEH